MMETPPTLETPLVRANTYLESIKARMRALYDGASDGKFAKEYADTLKNALQIGTEGVDGKYAEIFGEGNVPKSDDFLAARTIAIAQRVDELMRSFLDDYEQHRGVVPPSRDGVH